MDAQFWIYIVIGIIYFLSRMLKKPEEAGGGASGEPRRRAGGGEASEEAQPMTFEELLREITEGKQARRPEPRPQPQPQPVARYEPYERDPGEEARSLEQAAIDDAQILEKYREAQSFAEERKSLEETLRLEDTVVDFNRFKAFERKQRKSAVTDYMKIIRNPETLKQAVVMSEILQRKF